MITPTKTNSRRTVDTAAGTVPLAATEIATDWRHCLTYDQNTYVVRTNVDGFSYAVLQLAGGDWLGAPMCLECGGAEWVGFYDNTKRGVLAQVTAALAKHDMPTVHTLMEFACEDDCSRWT